tara:strand:+ start:209 stop:310 length:102 start_codon:yes stop_codon:yes gene_type:complete
MKYKGWLGKLKILIEGKKMPKCGRIKETTKLKI